MTGEDDYLVDRKTRLDSLEKDARTKTAQKATDARKSFVNNLNKANEQHLSNAVHVVDGNSATFKHDFENLESKGRFDAVEDEWTKRKEEMMQARKMLSELEKNRPDRYCLLITLS